MFADNDWWGVCINNTVTCLATTLCRRADKEIYFILISNFFFFFSSSFSAFSTSMRNARLRFEITKTPFDKNFFFVIFLH